MPTHALFHAILSYANESQASDLHLVSGMSPKIRVNGRMKSTSFPALLPPVMEQILADIMPEKSKTIFQTQWEVDFAFVTKLNDITGQRCRVNVFRQYKGISAVFRLIAPQVPSLSELNLLENLGDIALLPRGLVLVT